MKNFHVLVIGLLSGVVITALLFTFVLNDSDNSASTETKGADEPSYWVAPMDPNYRRDKPGKSPMGMDLIPVYENEADNLDTPGTVRIHPNVENNLGVRTAQVERKALHVPIKTVGYVQYNEDTLVHIHPRVEGWVETLYVKAAGEYVKKGEPLYALYSPQLVNAQEEFLLAVKRSNKSLIAAAKSRLEALQMPQSTITTLIKNGKVQQTIVFNAPQTGFVDNLNIREGFFVKPGTTILSIGALDEVWVDAEVFERQSNLIKVGLAVTMTLEYLPGKKWQGVVDYVYPTLSSSTRTLRVRLRFENENYFLKPNMFAQVTIHSDLADENLLVPSEAVIRTGTQNRVVLALGDGRFKSIEVQLGNIVNDYSEILSGLNIGDNVVTSAQFLLDSESSISSDFKRMEDANQTKSDSSSDSVQNPSQATVLGSVNSVDTSTRIVNISREAISKWNRGPATLDFYISETVDIGNFKEQMQIKFTFEIQNGEFIIIDVSGHGGSH